MRISLVVAYAQNRVIGDDGKLPWRFSGDLKSFKQLTQGKAVIMGRKTWDSLPLKPLPGRFNVVMTRATPFAAEGAIVANSVEQALAKVNAARIDEAMVIGGAEIYRVFLPVAHRVYATELKSAVAGDALFPDLSPDQWIEVSRTEIAKLQGDTVGGDLVVYDRFDLIAD